MEPDAIPFFNDPDEAYPFEFAKRHESEPPSHVHWEKISSWAATKAGLIQKWHASQNQARTGLYRPLTAAYEIRVLEIKPGTGNEGLRGSLLHCSIEYESVISNEEYLTSYALSFKEGLTEPIWYTALSYTWGPSIFDRVIECDGYDKAITTSLHSVLQHVRQPDHSIVMWVDQVCINQDDNAEKEQQVRIMGLVYKRALNTMIWLGEAAAHSESGLQLLGDLAHRLRLHTELLGPEEFASLGLPPPDSPSWAGLLDTVSRPWFRRLWIMQELYHSNDPWVFCGHHCLEWNRLATTCSHVVDSGISSWLRLQFAAAGGDDDNFDDETDVFKIVHGLDNERQQGRTHKPMSELHALDNLFQGLLTHARGALCADPRDKVYALLSMCSPRATELVTVNYKPDFTAEALYLQVTTDVLKMDSMCIYAVLGSVDQDTWSAAPMPSWVADWRKPRRTVAIGLHRTKSAHLYAAGGPPRTYPALSVKNRTLEIQGTLVDTVGECTDVFVSPDLTYQDPAVGNTMLLSCARLVSRQESDSCHPAACGIFEAVWRSLVCNMDASGLQRAPDTFAEIFSLLFDASTGCAPSLPDQVYSARQLRPRNRGKLELAGLAVREPGRVFKEARTIVRRVAKNRRLALTVKGYISLLPRWCQPGDTICVLKGCHVPYLVRQVPGTDSFRLVGECYVHGIMDGEAVVPDKGWETIKIV